MNRGNTSSQDTNVDMMEETHIEYTSFGAVNMEEVVRCLQTNVSKAKTDQEMKTLDFKAIFDKMTPRGTAQGGNKKKA